MRAASYNVENLFDTHHDVQKEDGEYLPEGDRRWTVRRYWEKLDNVARTIASLGNDRWPALVGLCEVENDSVLYDLTHRSLLRTAGYDYVVTDGTDPRGIDVALLWQPSFFQMVGAEELTVPVQNIRPGAHARPILHACGLLPNGDTLDVLVTHFPSRRGGESVSEPLRVCAAEVARTAADSLRGVREQLRLLMMGDMNEGLSAPAVRRLSPLLSPLTPSLPSSVGGSYRYRGRWEQLDQLWVSSSLLGGGTVAARGATVYGDSRLLEPEPLYGGVRPRSTYRGRRYRGGTSDHLPVYVDLVVRFP